MLGRAVLLSAASFAASRLVNAGPAAVEIADCWPGRNLLPAILNTLSPCARI